MNKVTTKYLIVGHGIAGALLGHFLEEEGATVCYIDAPKQTAATHVAAGIINPITGRRYVKSWRVEDLLPFAEETYLALEKQLGIRFYHQRPLIRTLFNRGEENNWFTRKLDPDYLNYFHEEVEMGNITEITVPAFSYMQVGQSAQADIGLLEKKLRQLRLASGRFFEQEFNYDELEISDKGIDYQNITADYIIFCEGWRSRFNPYFNYLPFGGNKGEMLLVRLPKAKLTRIFKHRVFIVPFTDDLYWVGSTSENKFEKEGPSEDGRRFLESRLAELLTTPYEIVDHQAAIKPTVRDRRPFLGNHPKYSNVQVFNGLGTKGASLGPYWAKHYSDHLQKGSALDQQVNISRFQKDAL
jgi:glycine/D-amino acid oxidase-like deaminating enzyme